MLRLEDYTFIIMTTVYIMEEDQGLIQMIMNPTIQGQNMIMGTVYIMEGDQVLI